MKLNADQQLLALVLNIPTGVTAGSSLPLQTPNESGRAWAFDALDGLHLDTMRTLSCVVWSADAVAKLAGLLPWLRDVLTECGHPWEVAVVYADSGDGTAELLHRWSLIPAVRPIPLKHPRGNDALAAGLAAARGDAVIFLDASLQDSLGLIPQMISHWEDGAEVVYALREGLPERSSLNWLGTSVFDSLANSARPLAWLEDCAELTLLSRRVIGCLSR